MPKFSAKHSPMLISAYAIFATSAKRLPLIGMPMPRFSVIEPLHALGILMTGNSTHVPLERGSKSGNSERLYKFN